MRTVLYFIFSLTLHAHIHLSNTYSYLPTAYSLYCIKTVYNISTFSVDSGTPSKKKMFFKWQGVASKVPEF